MATVSSTTRSTTITLGSTTAGPFAVGLRVFSDDFRVYKNDVLLDPADYTASVTLVDGYDDAATITLDTAGVSGDVLVIETIYPPARSDDYLPSDPGLTRKLNIELGQAWSAIGDLTRDARRAPKIIEASGGEGPVMEVPLEARVLIGDANGNIVNGANIADILGFVGREGVLRFSNRDALVAYNDTTTPPADATAFVQDPKAGELVFVYDGSSTTIPDLLGWVAVAPLYVEHFGIVTSETRTGATTDYTTELQAALDATDGVLLFSGFVKITDKVVAPNKCSVKAPGGLTSGGISVFSDFNMSATCVFQPGTEEPAGTIDGITIWFEQPSAPASRAELIQYPPAINIGAPEGEDALSGVVAGNFVVGRSYTIVSTGTTNFTLIGAADSNPGTVFTATGAGTGTGTADTVPSSATGLPRGKIKSIRIEAGWDGIVGVGNCGGYRFGDLQLGCFNRNLYIDGALDFVKLHNLHVWPFSFPANAALTALFYDGDTIAADLRRIDNFTAGSLSGFRSQIILGDGEEDTALPYQISAIGGDGNDARLFLKGGSSQIGAYYSTKAAAAPGAERDITVTGGKHSIGMVDMISSADGAILATAGELTVQGGRIYHLNNTRRAGIAQTAGMLTFENVEMQWSDSTSRTAAFFEQAAGGVLRVIHPYVRDIYSSGQEVIRFAGDDSRNLLYAPDLYPHTASISIDWRRGYYDVGSSVGRVSETGRAAQAIFAKYADAEEGWEVQLRKARGTPETPTVVQSGDNVGDIAYLAWDGDSWNPGLYLRGKVSGAVSDAVTPMSLTVVAENNAGAQVNAMILSGESATWGVPHANLSVTGNIYGTATSDGMTIAGGTENDGGHIFVGGSTHATQPNHVIADGSHHYVRSQDGLTEYWTVVSGVMTVVAPLVASDASITLSGLPVHGNDSAAGSAGLTAGQVYQTTTGELRIKL